MKLVSLAPSETDAPVPAAVEAAPVEQLLAGPDQTDAEPSDDDLGDLLDVFKDEEVDIDPRASTLA